MSEAEQAEAAVKRVWPDARTIAFDDGNDGVGGYEVWANGDTLLRGEGRFEFEAWLDAASKLQSQPVEEK